MNPWLWTAIGVLAALICWRIICLIWFRPLSIKLFFERVLLMLALRNPETLTTVGILEKFGFHGHNRKLENLSDAYTTKTMELVIRQQKLLRRYKRSALSPENQLSYDLMEWFLQNYLDYDRYRYHDYMVNQMFGVQNTLPNFLASTHPVQNRRDARHYITRLQAVELKFDQVIEYFGIQEKIGILPPRFVLHRVINEMQDFISLPAAKNILCTSFSERLDKTRLSQNERKNFLARAEKAVQEVVYPAYQKLIDACTNQLHQADDRDGVWKLPDGDAFYTFCLQAKTTTRYSPQEVHEIGLSEVERIETEMRAILDREGYRGKSVSDLMLELGMEERFLYPNTEEGRKEALAEYSSILERASGSLDEFFDMRPKAGLKVERVPEYREKTMAGAYYMIPSLDGKRPGIFYANLRDMKEVPKFSMKTLAYHEGIPGHHFQLALAQEAKGIPTFRKFGFYTAYIEGWALYAEKLAREIGFFDDPYSELGYLSSELIRAVRLVVDTGLHSLRWTRAQAIQYMMEHTGNMEESVISEVERYIVMPGQACAYKIGELKITALREKARQALGERFSLPAFHNAILTCGAVPLDILERIVDDYINKQSKQA